jgi:hypothetical protein
MIAAPRATPFDLTFGAAFRNRLAVERKSTGIRNMIPGFLLGRTNDEETEHLFYGFYEPEKAEEDGFFKLFEAEGIRFFIPQPQIRDLLAGKHLDLDENGRLEATPRTA